MESLGRILVVEDEAFTRNLVAGALAGLGWSVESCGSIAEAMALIEADEPNAVVCDLDLGEGPSGVDLCQRLAREYPWVGLVVLTAHTSPDLAVSSFDGLPDEVVYVVKSAVQSPEELSEAVTAAIGGRDRELVEVDLSAVIELSREQGDVLRLLAAAYSNAAIAQERGTTLRAAEAMVQRLFTALGTENSPAVNARVQAAAMWNSGRIVIR
jgi:DNA-binding NarL/FixJ family response regulator